MAKPTVDEFTTYDPSMKQTPDLTRYPGKDVHVLYDRPKCMHASECGRGAKAAFDGRRNPWIVPDDASRAEVLAVVHRCPSGALRAVEPDGAPIPEPEVEGNEVTVSPDGPLFVRGQVRLKNGDATAHTRLALCRCGASSAKPFCDGSHATVRFRDAGPVDSDGSGTQAADPQPLAITPADDGPLLFAGPHVIRAASGRVAFRGDKSALCRCGRSGNRPFCDGSHAKTGWTSVDGDGR